MPSVGVKLYSVFFKLLLKHRLQNRIQAPPEESDMFGVMSRPEESIAAADPSFSDGVATKDIHIDSFTSLSIRIFLPESALTEPEPEPDSKSQRSKVRPRPTQRKPDPESGSAHVDSAILNSKLRQPLRRNSYGPSGTLNRKNPEGTVLG